MDTQFVRTNMTTQCSPLTSVLVQLETVVGGGGGGGVTEMMAGVSWLLGEGERVSSWMTGMILLECLTELSPHLSSRTLVTSWDS